MQRLVVEGLLLQGSKVQVQAVSPGCQRIAILLREAADGGHVCGEVNVKILRKSGASQLRGGLAPKRSGRASTS